MWTRFVHPDLPALVERSQQYVAAARQRSAVRLEGAPPRRPFPPDWRADLQAPLRGRGLCLRRTDAPGGVSLLGHAYPVAVQWPHRLVRAAVDLTAGAVAFYALRRRVPTWQPLLREVDYQVPRGDFHD